jgi:hypothetical protein
MEKGALGLLFELNHFIGIGLSIYGAWFIAVMEKPKFKDDPNGNSLLRDFKLMYNWIFFQYIWTMVSFFFAFLVWCMYRSINKRVVKR